MNLSMIKDMSQSYLSIFFAQWQNARLNKQSANEEAGFDVERDKIQSLDTNIINMTAESLNFRLTKFVASNSARRMGTVFAQKFV